MRIRCKAFGCEQVGDPCCMYCYTDLYDSEFVQSGWLDPLFRLYWLAKHRLRKLLPIKCAVCGKKYRRGYDEYTCSVECSDEWLPF